MYKHIGKKLKVLAEIWCVIGVLASIAAGVLLRVLTKKPQMDLLYCILIGVGGIILSVLSSWGIYAELHELSGRQAGNAGTVRDLRKDHGPD